MKYAGIGSRTVPPHIITQIEEFAKSAAEQGWLLRSGGADGCDLAFERGAVQGKGQMEIFLPWKGFNNNPSLLYKKSDKAEQIAQQFHPKWTMLERAVRNLHSRNVHQILGINCDDPVDFVVCYTADGCEDGNKTTINTGGTGQALRIATYYKIPIYNLARRDISTIKLLLDIT